jgi:hypothetical protein
MRYTGEHKKEERQQALAVAHHWWSRAGAVRPPEDKPDEKG